MRSLRMRENESAKAGRKEDRRGRRFLIRASLLAAGLASSAIILLGDGHKTGSAGGLAAKTPYSETRAHEKSRPRMHRAPDARETRPALLIDHPPAKADSVKSIIEALSLEFPYAGLDCPMLPAEEAGRIRREQSPLGLNHEFSLEGPFHALGGGDGPGASPNMRAALKGLEGLYDKTDAWSVLAFIRYLDSLNLESASSTLYDEYESMWIEGAQDGGLPDPICMERIAVSILLLHKARNDLSGLLAADPSLAEEILASLAGQSRGNVLSGAVGAALADPDNPSIEGLFDFLSREDKLALIEMYDASLPESERLSELKDGSSLAIPDSGLWHLLEERMGRFRAAQEEKKHDAGTPAGLD